MHGVARITIRWRVTVTDALAHGSCCKQQSTPNTFFFNLDTEYITLVECILGKEFLIFFYFYFLPFFS